MSDERTGRELTPRPEEEPGAVTPREPALPQPTTTAAERFHAGEAAHTVGLTEERAATVVRQSGNARFIAFLGALVVVLFIPFYWIYDIGLPFMGVEGRMAAEEQTQYVQDVARGHELYLANCARCHSTEQDPSDGRGRIGPALNDQGKLYQAVTPQGLPGPGHLNPDYLRIVLHTGGRYICGDPNSQMPAWLQPEGPLNYREIEEIIEFILAGNEISWIHYDEHPEPGTTPAPPTEYRGWRDPNYEPPPDATPVPACWRAPAADTPAPGTPAPPEQPGTPEDPRDIALEGTDQLQWVDPETGSAINAITIVQGETVRFVISNESEFTEHNFHIGTAEELETAAADTDLPGVSTFTAADGVQEYVHTFDEVPDNFQFACTVLGHYATMHGDFIVVPANGEQPVNGEPPANGEEGEGTPAASPAPGDE